MGLGDVLKNLLGQEKKKTYKSPDVTFIEEEEPSGVTHTIPITVEPSTQQIVIKHEGEILVFKNMDDMPPELREELKHLDEDEEFTHSYSLIIDGERKNYSSLEEMPEDIRQAIEAKNRQ